MEKNSQILNLFLTLDSQQSVNKLIEKSYAIALSNLRFNYRKVYRILLNEDLTLEDLAIDAIASLFIKEPGKDELSILYSFKKWQPPITTEEDALFFLTKVVSNRIEQHIYSLLKEADPFFSKILDSVNYLINKRGYRKEFIFGRTFIVQKPVELFPSGCIDIEGFSKIPVKFFCDRKSLLDGLFDYLKYETKFIPAIPLNDLVHRLKEINFSEFIITESEDSLTAKLEMDELIKTGLAESIQKLQDTYLNNGKLSVDESNSFQKALESMATDLKDGGVNPGLYDYLAPHFKCLDKNEYQFKYHNMIEYLLKVMKKKIADEMMEKN